MLGFVKKKMPAWLANYINFQRWRKLGRWPKIYQKEENKSSKVHNRLENESVVDFNLYHAIVIFYAERLFHSLLVRERFRQST